MALVPKLPDISANSSSTNRERYKSGGDLQVFPKCTENTNQSIKYKFDELATKPHINMNNVKWLLEVGETHDSDEAHEIFMKNYRKIFLNENEDKKKIRSLVPSMLIRDRDKTSKSSKSAAADVESSGPVMESDIKTHIERIHGKKSEIVDPYLKKLELLKKLRKLVRILPFERKENENRKILKILKTFRAFKHILPKEDDYVLEKLCAYAAFEMVGPKGSPIFGNFGYYFIMKGSVTPLSEPHVNLPGTRLKVVTPEPPEETHLEIGDYFGTFMELSNRDVTTRMFRVLTNEENCEFLKITINDYTKLVDKIKTEKRDEKLNVIRNCETYKSWPKHAIEELINLLEWDTFRENTILTSEGYRSPFIGFIQSGKCHVLRKVDILRPIKPDESPRKQLKQVVVGCLSENQSFGEASVVQQEPMTCSIVTETECRIGLIHYEKIYRLDDITKKLLVHSNPRTYGHLSQDEIYKKYIDKELKREWMDYKNSVVDDIVDKYGCNNKFKPI